MGKTITELLKEHQKIADKIIGDIENLNLPFSKILIEQNLGRYSPDVVLYQYGKISTIFEIKLHKPPREIIVRIVNMFREISMKYKNCSYILAFLDKNKIKYVDLTEMVVAQESDISSYLDSIYQIDQSLIDILKTYVNVSDSTKKKGVNDTHRKNFSYVFLIIAVIVNLTFIIFLL